MKNSLMHQRIQNHSSGIYVDSRTFKDRQENETLEAAERLIYFWAEQVMQESLKGLTRRPKSFSLSR